MRLLLVLISSIAIVATTASSATAIAIQGPQDCDANAVIRCGAPDTASIKKAYPHNGIAQIYRSFGITPADINTIDQTAMAGYVTRSGNVYVAGRLVAHDAQTAGRMAMTGSTKVTSGSTTFYKRSPSVSFQSDQLKAYVVMKNGMFDYAILASCGNPIIATPIRPAAAPTPTPLPVQPPVVVATAPQQPTPPAPPAPAAKLPTTGPAGFFGLASITAIVSGALHYWWQRRRIAVPVNKIFRTRQFRVNRDDDIELPLPL